MYVLLRVWTIEYRICDNLFQKCEINIGKTDSVREMNNKNTETGGLLQILTWRASNVAVDPVVDGEDGETESGDIKTEECLRIRRRRAETRWESTGTKPSDSATSEDGMDDFTGLLVVFGDFFAHFLEQKYNTLENTKST